MKISRLKNKKFIGLTKDFLLILAILDKISKKLKNDEKKVENRKKSSFYWSKTVENSENLLNFAKISEISSKRVKIGQKFWNWCSLFFIESIADVHFFGYTCEIQIFFFLFGSHIIWVRSFAFSKGISLQKGLKLGSQS